MQFTQQLTLETTITMISITSTELNYLVFRYLHESGSSFPYSFSFLAHYITILHYMLININIYFGYYAATLPFSSQLHHSILKFFIFTICQRVSLFRPYYDGFYKVRRFGMFAILGLLLLFSCRVLA